jgi:hypothetical protein
VKNFIDLTTTFPAVVFTAILAFCLAWWLVATVAGIGDGFDSDPDPDGALDDLGDALGLAAVPPAIGLSILSFVGWVVSLGLTAVMRSSAITGGLLLAAGVGSLLLAFLIGVVVTRPVAKRTAPFFVTELAPSERQAVGAYARVRSPDLDDGEDGSVGEVIVTSGTLRGATFAAKARRGRVFQLGDSVHIIDADHDGGRLVVTVDDPDPDLVT